MPRGGARPRVVVPGESSSAARAAGAKGKGRAPRVDAFPRLTAAREDIVPALQRPRNPSDDPKAVEAPVYRGALASDSDAKAAWDAAKAATTSGPTDGSFPRLSPGPPPPFPSVIHALLSVASRTSPPAALAHLEANPHLLTPSAVAALDTWAFHDGDEVTRQQLRRLARHARVHIPPIDHGGHWERGRWKSERRSDMAVNKALWQKFPPIDTVPGRITPRNFLRHQHAALLSGRGYKLSDALSFLQSLGASSERRLDALHLALAYTRPQGVGKLLDEFEASPYAIEALDSTKPASESASRRRPQFSRQTIHLAFLTSLKRRMTIPDVRALAARFDTRAPGGRTPGSETWRHIAKHALKHNDAALAELAFAHAKTELGAARAAATPSKANSASPSDSSSLLTQPTAKPTKPTKIFANHERREEAVKAGLSVAADPPVPKYAHLGRDTSRWEFMMHALADRGWARRGPPLATTVESYVPRCLQRWEWLGSEGAEERRVDLVVDEGGGEGEGGSESGGQASSAPSRRTRSPTPPPTQAGSYSAASASRRRQAQPEPEPEPAHTMPAWGKGQGKRITIDGVAYRLKKHKRLNKLQKRFAPEGAAWRAARREEKARRKMENVAAAERRRELRRAELAEAAEVGRGQGGEGSG